MTPVRPSHSRPTPSRTAVTPVPRLPSQTDSPFRDVGTGVVWTLARVATPVPTKDGTGWAPVALVGSPGSPPSGAPAELPLPPLTPWAWPAPRQRPRPGEPPTPGRPLDAPALPTRHDHPPEPWRRLSTWHAQCLSPLGQAIASKCGAHAPESGGFLDESRVSPEGSGPSAASKRLAALAPLADRQIRRGRPCSGTGLLSQLSPSQARHGRPTGSVRQAPIELQTDVRVPRQGAIALDVYGTLGRRTVVTRHDLIGLSVLRLRVAAAGSNFLVEQGRAHRLGVVVTGVSDHAAHCWAFSRPARGIRHDEQQEREHPHRPNGTAARAIYFVATGLRPRAAVYVAVDDDADGAAGHKAPVVPGIGPRGRRSLAAAGRQDPCCAERQQSPHDHGHQGSAVRPGCPRTRPREAFATSARPTRQRGAWPLQSIGVAARTLEAS